jgi:hypothetical protein
MSESKLCYDRRSVGQSVLVPITQLGPKTRFLLLSDSYGFVDVREMMGLSFTTADGLRQHNHSRVRVLRDSWPHFTASDSRLPQPGESGPRIYIALEEGDPVITPGTWFPFRRLLRFSGLRWRNSNPPPRGDISETKSKSKLLYVWPFIANQFFLAPGLLRTTTRDLFSNWTLVVISLK